jgi:membrane protein
MANPVPWVIDFIKKLNDAIWHTPLSELSRGKTFLIKQGRIILLSARGFLSNNVQLRASALTLYSLLAVVPIAAIAFAIAKGFGLDQDLEREISKNFEAHQEVLNWLITHARDALRETKGGYIAGVGVIILFWSVMELLGHIENSFNHIWQIRTSRPWYRKFTDYLTIMLIAPVLVIISSSATVFITTQLTEFIEKAPILDAFKPLITFLFKFIPYLLTWIVLTLLFIVMPNTKVKFWSALVAGIVAGTILQILQWMYIDLQFGISKLSTIYGSFAAIPLFIIWLQASWTIVLLGAELSFANQNVSRYEYESEALNISYSQKRSLVIMIMHFIISNFAAGEKPPGAETIAGHLKIPVRLINDILQDLNNVGLVSVIHENEKKERLYQPGMDINKLTVSYVLLRLDRHGVVQKTVYKNKEYIKIEAILAKFDKLAAKSDMNILIKDL